MKVSIAIQILPMIENDEKICEVVDYVIEYIKTQNVNYEVCTFESTIEGEDIDKLMDIAKSSIKLAYEKSSKQIYCYMKVNYCPDSDILSIDQKISKYRKK